VSLTRPVIVNFCAAPANAVKANTVSKNTFFMNSNLSK